MFIKDKKWDWPILKVLKGERKFDLRFVRDLLIFVFLFKIIVINGFIVVSNLVLPNLIFPLSALVKSSSILSSSNKPNIPCMI